MSTVAPFPRRSETTGNDQAGQVVGRICLVEDSKTAGYAIRKLLVKEGYQVDYFVSMEAALAALLAQSYDLLITDLNLRIPGAHGDDLIRSLRSATDRIHRLLPILVLTADTESQTLVRVFNAGANDYLAKPAKPHELRARVENLVRLHHTLESLTKKPVPHTVVGALCYVHAEVSNTDNLAAQFTEMGLSVDHFSNADEAFKAVVANEYDAIVADVKLFRDGMDGDDLARAIRTLQNERLRSLPILLIVENDSTEQQLRVQQAPVDGYCLADISIDALSAKLQQLIPQDQREPEQPDESHQPAADVAAAHNSAAPPVAKPSSPMGEEATQRMASKATTIPNANTRAEPVVKVRHVHRKPSAQPAQREHVQTTDQKPGNRLLGWTVRYPWLNLLGMILVFLVTSYGVKDIGLTADYRIFFSEENPELVAFDAIERTYAKNFGVMFVVTPEDGDVFSNETLSIVDELTQQGWQVPFATRVDSITNFQHTWSQGDELIVTDLVEAPGELSYDKLLWIKQTAIAEPLLVNRLVSPNGHITGVYVTVQFPGESAMEIEEIANYSRDLKQDFMQRYPNIKLHLTGLVMQDAAVFEATLEDIKTLVPAMYLFVLLMVAIILRSIPAMIAVTLVILASSLTAVGVAGWLGIKLTPPSSMAPTIILTLAVANSVHILSICFTLMSQGMTKVDALGESLRLNLPPVFLTSATTAVGFLSMNFSDSPPFHDLGNIVVMGVVAAFMYSFLLLPAVIMVLPVRVAKKASKQQLAMQHLADYVIKHRVKLAILIGILLPVLSAGILAIEVDDNFVEYFDERYEFRTDADYVQEHLTGLANIEFSVAADGPGGVNDPRYLAVLDDFSQWLRNQAGVVHVNTLTDVMKRLNFNMHSNDPAHFGLPTERELAAQYLFLYELSLPQGLDLNNQINLDKSASRITVTLENLSNKRQLALEQAAADWLQANAPEYMHARGASPSIMFANISERNIRSMFMGTFFALLLISAILIFALRSFKIGIISLLPNMIPAIMAFGVWGILVGKVGLAISIVSAMALGIIVDDTVHFLSKYLIARREKGLSSIQAIQLTFVQVGPALVITSVILVGGFLVLSLSGFSVNADMGMLTAITLAIALLADLLFLPPLLIWLDRIKISKKT